MGIQPRRSGIVADHPFDFIYGLTAKHGAGGGEENRPGTADDSLGMPPHGRSHKHARESLVPGGVTLLSRVTGLDRKTVRRGRDELANDLKDCPSDRVRREGAGRPPVEKKVPTSDGG